MSPASPAQKDASPVLCTKAPHVLMLALVCGHEKKAERIAVVSCPPPHPIIEPTPATTYLKIHC